MHRYALLSITTLLLTGCGQKSPLVLPSRSKVEQPRIQAPSPAVPAPDAPSSHPEPNP